MVSLVPSATCFVASPIIIAEWSETLKEVAWCEYYILNHEVYVDIWYAVRRVIEEIFTNGVDILIFVTTLSNS